MPPAWLQRTPARRRNDDEHTALYAYPSNATIPRTRLVELNDQAADFYAAR
jgi:hypothetical protein